MFSSGTCPLVLCVAGGQACGKQAMRCGEAMATDILNEWRQLMMFDFSCASIGR